MPKRKTFLRALFFITLLVPLRGLSRGACEKLAYHYDVILDRTSGVAELEQKSSDFLSKHSKESLITVWPQEPVVIGLVTIGGTEIYEITCGEFGPFIHSLTVQPPTQTFLLYEDTKGFLARLNMSPHSWSGWGLGGPFILEDMKSIRLFNRFLRTLQNHKTLSRLERAYLFVSLICHEAPGDFPCILYASPDPVLASSQLPQMLEPYRSQLAEMPGSIGGSRQLNSILLVTQYPVTNALVQYCMTFSPRDKLLRVFVRRLR